MIRMLAATGILLAQSFPGAFAQTACTETMLTPCVNAPAGSSTTGSAASQSNDAGGTAGSVAPPDVTNDPLGMRTESSATPPAAKGMVDRSVTGSIPSPPQPLGMAPLVVPSDPLGSSIEPRIRGIDSGAGTTFGNPGIASPQ